MDLIQQPTGGVSISINVMGDGTSTSSSTAQSAYTSMANQIRTIVMTEMVNQQRPGGLLYK